MNIISKIIEKIKSIFSKSKTNLLSEENLSSEMKNASESILEENNAVFSGFKFDKEVLELALKHEKLKKEVNNKKNEIAMLDYQIQSMEKKIAEQNS